MTKEQYLHELYYELRHFFNDKEAQVIVSDYDEYFEMGILDGKTVDELVLLFGTPGRLAFELLENNGLIRKSSKDLIKLKSYISKAAYCALIVLILLMGQKVNNNILVDSAVVLGVPFLILHWIFKNYSPIEYFDSKRFSIIRMACVLPFLIGALYWLINKGWLALIYIGRIYEPLEEAILEQLGRSMFSCIVLITLASISFIVYFYFMSIKKKYYKRSSLMFLLFGIIQTSGNVFYSLYDLSNADVLKASLQRAVYPLIIGLAATVISSFGFKAWQKRSER